MKANKITMKITVEVLSIDSIPALLSSLEKYLYAEIQNGKMVMSDGDAVKWTTSTKKVKI